MIYLLIFVYTLLFPIMIITFLWRILDKIEDFNTNINSENNKTKRTHPNIGKVNYKSTLSGRKSIQAYEQYKNTDGLYEPVKPNNGIPIKKEE